MGYNNDRSGKSEWRILIGHEEPKGKILFYDELAKKYGVQFQFHSFNRISTVTLNQFRKQDLNPLDYDAVIFVNKYAIDAFFDLCKQLKIEMPSTVRYFCANENLAYYLGKYITIRKRKLFSGKKSLEEVKEAFEKYQSCKFLFPGCSKENMLSCKPISKMDLDVTFVQVYQITPNPLPNDIPLEELDGVCMVSSQGLEHYVEVVGPEKAKTLPLIVFGEQVRLRAKELGLAVKMAGPTKTRPALQALLDQYLARLKREKERMKTKVK
jgi:uroporphyrinogen-III synthase